MALFNNERQSDEYQSVENAAKTLLANIRFMSVDHPIRSMAITSAIPNEGKTFVVSNLGNAIATSGRTVLLVEGDMRRRSLSSSLGVHPENGLYSVISGQVPLTKAAVQTPTPRMFFLDAEPHIPNPSDLINSRHFSRLIDEMTKTYDYVIFDTPPVCTFVDAAVLGAKVDATILVVRENYTRRDEVSRAVDQLQKANVNLAGVVMNFCERHSSEYYYEYYYKQRGKERNASKGKRRRGHHSDERAMPEVPAAPAHEEPQRPAAAPAQAPRSWDNAPNFDDTPAPSQASAAQQTFKSQGTALTQAVVDLHGQVSNAQRARIDTSGSSAAAARHGQDAASVSSQVKSSRPNDDMSRYRVRQH